MLILKRNLDEVIRIGKDIKIILVKTGHRSASIGIEAPRDIAVYREEIYNEIHSEQKV